MVILIVAAVIAVVVALTRGLIAFANMKPLEMDENGIIESHKKQNAMMFARVKYQAIAIILVALLLLMNGANS